ncbi:MAG: phosphomannomutase, partial [bacterium]|nr:phosphomannomutase [bacterium]
MNKTIFKAYDIRGIYPTEIDETAATKIGRAYARFIKPQTVVVGHDVRTSSPSLQKALIAGLTSQGVNIKDIGVISTDMLYYAVVALKADGGITVSASHNPREYNGMKMTREQAIPLSSDSGLLDIAELAEVDELGTDKGTPGTVETADIEAGYLKHVRSFVDLTKLKPLQVVVNGNFGMAGTIIKKLLQDTSIVLHPLNDKPDGTFPKGRPDPLILENRQETIDLMIKTGADLGIAWDADADRCFFYDENGEFVDGYYMTAILAELMLAKHGHGKIIHDPR